MNFENGFVFQQLQEDVDGLLIIERFTAVYDLVNVDIAAGVVGFANDMQAGAGIIIRGVGFLECLHQIVDFLVESVSLLFKLIRSVVGVPCPFVGSFLIANGLANIDDVCA